MNAFEFVRIGNSIVNLRHIVSVEYHAPGLPVSGPDDARVKSGDAQMVRGKWVDSEGDEIRSRPSRCTVAMTDPQRNVTAYGPAAEAVMQWFAMFAAAPPVDHDQA